MQKILRFGDTKNKLENQTNRENWDLTFGREEKKRKNLQTACLENTHQSRIEFKEHR